MQRLSILIVAEPHIPCGPGSAGSPTRRIEAERSCSPSGVAGDPVEVLFQEQACEIHMLAHQVFSAGGLSCDESVGDTVVVIVGAQDHSVVVPENDPVGDERDGMSPSDKATDPRISR